MKHILIFSLLFSFLLFSCSSSQHVDIKQKKSGTMTKYHIIPKPVSIKPLPGKFDIGKQVVFRYDTADDELAFIVDMLEPYFPAGIVRESVDSVACEGCVELKRSPLIDKEEMYRLSIMPGKIEMEAGGNAGLFYAAQTLRQILTFDTKGHKLDAVNITDFPRFRYRGLHLDVCRHFFPPSFVKKYIDLMSRYKFNRFHWHLTEDQGWRIEIKKYPRLTTVGAYRDSTLIGKYADMPRRFDKTRYGGYYTQDEIRDIVKYAAKRHITIVPEIEMPGHSRAALAAYPELACTEGPFSVMPIWGVSEDVYCPYERTFKFLEDVLTEVMDLFPGEYIHIGGDEVPKTRWKESKYCQELIKREGLKDENELQSYFIKRIEKFVNSKGRKIIGWDEILEGGLAPNAAVMSWRGEKGGIAAAKQKHYVVMTPGDYCYFDHYQSLDENEPLAIGGYTPVEEVYSYNPVPPQLTEEEAKYILGAQGNMWTEYVATPQHVEYMVYPRAIALAEVVWTPQEKRDYAGFVRRLVPHMKKLKKEGVNVAFHLGDISAKIENTGKGMNFHLRNAMPGSTIYYTLDGTIPGLQSRKYNPGNPLFINRDTVLKAVTYYNKDKMGPVFSKKVKMHKAAGKFMTMLSKPSKRYSRGGDNALINGIRGSKKRYDEGEWLGFYGKDFEGIIDFGRFTYVQKLKMHFYNYPGAWIYPPREIEIYASNDQFNFRPVGAAKINLAKNPPRIITVPFKLLKGVNARFIKIKIKRHGIIGENMPGAGHDSWLFLDEIEVY